MNWLWPLLSAILFAIAFIGFCLCIIASRTDEDVERTMGSDDSRKWK